MSKDYINVGNSRTEDQRKVMEEIAERGHCPFCPENLSLSHKKPILRDGAHWILTENQWPYQNTRVHLMAIAKRHVADISELDPEAGRELLEMFQWAQREYGIRGGGFSMRFGDTRLSGGTVNHLHAQLVCPSDDAEAPVFIQIGTSKK